MRRVIVSEFVSLDSVIEDPGGAGELDRGGWSFRSDRGAEGDKFKDDELASADALLLGRITYEAFAAAWPHMEEQTGEYRTAGAIRIAGSGRMEDKKVGSSKLAAPLTIPGAHGLLPITRPLA